MRQPLVALLSLTMSEVVPLLTLGQMQRSPPILASLVAVLTHGLSPTNLTFL